MYGNARQQIPQPSSIIKDASATCIKEEREGVISHFSHFKINGKTM